MSSTSRRSPRRASAALLTAATLCALSACGSSGGSASSSSGTTSGTPTTITFWSWTGNADKVAAEFNATHQDVRVQFSKIPGGSSGGYTKILDAIKGGNAPDVFNCEYQALPQFASQGDLQDLSGDFASGLKSSFSAAGVDAVTLGGKQWGVPFDLEPMVLLYRKDLFAQYKLTVPTTWDQFAADAKQLKSQDAKKSLIDYQVDDMANFEGLTWQAGGNWFTNSDQGASWTANVNDAATQKVAAYWQGLISSHTINAKASSDPSIIPSLANGSVLAEIAPAFGAGTLTATVPAEKGDWAAAPLPSWDGSPATALDGGSSLVITKDSKKQAAALEFIKWYTTSTDAVKTKLGTDGPSLYFADPAVVPTARAAFQQSYQAFFGGQDLYSLFGSAASSVRPTWQWSPLLTDTNTVIKGQFMKVLTGGTLEAGLTAAQPQVVGDLKSAGYTITN